MKPLRNKQSPQGTGTRPTVPPVRRQTSPGSPPTSKNTKITQNAASLRQNPRRIKRRRPLTRTERLIRYVREKAASLPMLLPEGDTLLKALVCAALIIGFSLLQTTIFARFRPFGAIPDLILPLVIAISMTEGEKWGAAAGIAAAFMIEALGTTGVPLLPLLYMPIGYFCPIVTEMHLTNSVPVRILYTAVSGVGRAALTLLYLALTVQEFHLPQLLLTVVLPEYGATFCLAFLPHLITHFATRPFHKSRAERTSTL